MAVSSKAVIMQEIIDELAADGEELTSIIRYNDNMGVTHQLSFVFHSAMYKTPTFIKSAFQKALSKQNDDPGN